ncbi:hypothetical protein KDH_01190 [Dictyobacter sp. S3.2.2.5]|uniref:Uncharacterized protein n=1 Tax=Dictyobacter halimunensis TaxID=3026934 RepID=A0ABQ6FJB5_9CHLR|nr:hypothetical protein KDH_01190 [Dictyobacter sp. S3.2.2.5]
MYDEDNPQACDEGAFDGLLSEAGQLSVLWSKSIRGRRRTLREEECMGGKQSVRGVVLREMGHVVLSTCDGASSYV